MEKIPVLIVGLGPTGMTLASELQKHGVQYCIVDKREAISTVTRAVNITPASLALLRYSLAMTLDDKVTKTEKIRVFWENNLVANISYKNMNFPYRNFCYYLQPKLEENISNNLIISAKRELTSVVEIIQKKKGYEVLLHNKVNDENYWIACDYLIGCDGNGSIVREFLGSSNDQEDYKANFLLYDIQVKTSFGDQSQYYVYDDGYIIVVPIGDCKYRVILSSSKFDFTNPDEYANIDFLINHLNKMMRVNAPVVEKLIWFTNSGFRHRIADIARRDNCFLCGDAFHVFSPVGGLNLNTGIQDAINLGWKLAYVIKGRASYPLLESYESERRQAALQIRNKTKHFTKCLVSAKQYSLSIRYLTKLTNRYDQRIALPYLLSGYDCYGTAQYDRKKYHPVVGHHISEFINERDDYETICNMVNPLTYNLICGSGIMIDAINRNQKNITNHDYNCFGNDIWVLVRPDGYISATGNQSAINKIIFKSQTFLKGEILW